MSRLPITRRVADVPNSKEVRIMPWMVEVQDSKTGKKTKVRLGDNEEMPTSLTRWAFTCPDSGEEIKFTLNITAIEEVEFPPPGTPVARLLS
jgi:hypothetical protein